MDFTKPLSKRLADFSIQDKTKWQKLAKKVIVLTLKIVIFPWGIYELARYIVQRLVMIPLYPAQSRIVRFFIRKLMPISEKDLDLFRKQIAIRMNEQGFLVRHVALEKNGVRYSGMLIGHKDTIANGKWALQATGNLELIEHSAENIAKIYKDFQVNTLLINGPAVGKSEGRATPESMGDAQEVGLSFLENALKANKIVIAGRSLGGASVGQAISKHEFKKDVKYLVVRQMTFDRASNICGKTVRNWSPRLGSFVKKVVKWSGCEMDSLAASKKLQELGIKEIIVQATQREIKSHELPKKDDFMTDGPILAHASLGYRLIKEKVVDNKVFLGLENAEHMTDSAILAARDEILRI
ncbi:MAG: hypothetical protein K1060chlam1_00733 [Candidatus Anoxychlamydiales bacterium]|nr:hypothetical protein [Candidatus Anoxychlamydiales bacterium]